MTRAERRRRALGRSVVAFIFALTGCSGNADPIPCDPVPECPVADEDAAEDDVRVLWETGQKLEMTLDEQPAEIEVTGGEVVFTPDANDLDCAGPCTLRLKRLKATLRDMYFVSSEDSVKVSGLTFSFRAPLELEDPGGTGAVLPAGMELDTCAAVQDIPWAHASALGAPGRLVARATNEELVFEATVPMVVDGSTGLGCRRFNIEVSGALHGATPFDKNPTMTATAPP